MFDIKTQIKMLPKNSGVYLMKNNNDDIIYVGKAKNLKNRVSQYFRNYNSHPLKVRAMIDHIKSFEYIITDNEFEALILECNLIKKHKPHYNILLRDDKTYPYIKITIKDDFPRIVKVRKVIKDGAKYFGPYTNISAVNETLDIIAKLYPIRTCNYDMQKYIKSGLRPCLEYYIKRCVAPCNGKISSEKYNKYIDEIIKFLSGYAKKVKELLKNKMYEESDKQNYELALNFRDKLKSIDDILLTQKVTNLANTKNKDVLAVAIDGDTACISVFFVRLGRVIGRENFVLDGARDESTSKIIEEFILQYYTVQKFIPNEILVEKGIKNKEYVEQLLKSISNRSVKVSEAKRGNRLELVHLVKKNAVEYLNKTTIFQNKKEFHKKEMLMELKSTLMLDDIPHRIEAYDISHIQGTNSVGAMVVYKDGKKALKDYRRYKIKDIQGNNDLKSLQEVVKRRLKYGDFPNLILIDGGRNQVNAVNEIIREHGLFIEVWGMYKNDKHRTDGLINEEREIELNKSSKLYRFLFEVQEEVHRFAIFYHRNLRNQAMVKSPLDNINGIGKLKRNNLLIKFKTINAIKNASIDELTEVEGISMNLAIKIKNELSDKSEEYKEYR